MIYRAVYSSSSGPWCHFYFFFNCLAPQAGWGRMTHFLITSEFYGFLTLVTSQVWNLSSLCVWHWLGLPNSLAFLIHTEAAAGLASQELDFLPIRSGSLGGADTLVFLHRSLQESLMWAPEWYCENHRTKPRTIFLSFQCEYQVLLLPFPNRSLLKIWVSFLQRC